MTHHLTTHTTFLWEGWSMKRLCCCVIQHVNTEPYAPRQWKLYAQILHFGVLQFNSCGALIAFFSGERRHQVLSFSLHWTLTQLFLCCPFFHKGDSLKDSPEHHTQGEDVCLGRVGQSTPHLRSHIKVRSTNGREVLPGYITVHRTFTHLAQTKVCNLQDGQRD